MKPLSPTEIVDAASDAAVGKSSLSVTKTMLLAFAAGVYIAMGGALSIVAGYGFPALSADNPAVQRLLSGAVFPLGLILVVFAGAELFTGNNAVMIPALMDGRIGVRHVLKNWGLVYAGNFAGALFFASVMVYASGIFDAGPWAEASRGIAETKTSLPWMTVFLRGVGANWLVCLAVWLGMSAKNASGRIIGLWFPVMGFVALGYEHSIANMFFIPLGMLYGADVGCADFLLGNLVPATLGNIVGGALMVGCFYRSIYDKKDSR